jgi:hypothetical protein
MELDRDGRLLDSSEIERETILSEEDPEWQRLIIALSDDQEFVVVVGKTGTPDAFGVDFELREGEIAVEIPLNQLLIALKALREHMANG